MNDPISTVAAAAATQVIAGDPEVTDPVSAPAAAPAPRTNLAQSRTIQAAGFTATVVVAGQVFDQIVATVQPLQDVSPVFHTLYVIGLLGGLATIIYARIDDFRKGAR